MKKLTFCKILLILFFANKSALAEITFKSIELQKLHEVVKTIKTVPLLNKEICKLNLDKEVIRTEVKKPSDEVEVIDKLKSQVSQKENVDIDNIHSLKELFDHTNFSSFSGVIDNTFCFVNLPSRDLTTYEDRVKLFDTIKGLSEKIKFAVLLDDGFNQGIDLTRLYVYGVDIESKEAFAIKTEVE